MMRDSKLHSKLKIINLVLVITILLQILMPVIMPLKSMAVDNNGRYETSLGTMIIRKMETTEEGVIPIEVYIEGQDIYGIVGELEYSKDIFESLEQSDIEIKPSGWALQESLTYDEEFNSYHIAMCNLMNDNLYTNFTATIINLRVKSGASAENAIIKWSMGAISKKDGENLLDTWDETEGAGFDITYTLPSEVGPTSFSITYNKNTTDNVSNMPSNETDINAGTSYPIPTQEPTREGYKFTGWDTNVNGGGTSYTPGTSYEINSNLDLYAQWRELNKYTITYNKNSLENDVTGMPTENGTKTEGTDFQLASAPSRIGYTFGGWNTQADGEGTSYVAEALYREDTSIELFAKWVPVQTTLTVNPNGGVWEGFSSAQNYEQDYKTTMQIPNPTKAPDGNRINYNGNDGTPEKPFEVQTQKFDGWTLTGGGTGGTLSGNTYTFGTESGTLTANYSLNPVVLPSASKTGARITGWYTAQTGGTLVGQPGDEYTPTVQTTLFAQWEDIDYELTINPAGGTYKGTTEITKEKGNYEEPIVLETPKAPTKYTVTLDVDGVTTELKQKQRFNQWIKSGKGTLVDNIYTFEAGNGTLVATYTPLGVDLEPAQKPGYNFDGWYTSKTGGEKKESGFIPEDDITLYAHWTPKTFTITFDPTDGATVYPGTKQVTFGGKYGDNENLPTPVKTGKTFAGWLLDGRPISNNDTVEITDNVTLTASWTDTEYTLTIELNGGKVNGNLTTEPLRGKYNETKLLPTVECPTGYTVTLRNNDGTNTENVITQTKRLDNWTRANGTEIPGTTTSYTFDASNDRITASYVPEGVPLADPEERPNYTFKGWYTQAEGGEKVESGFEPTANTILYAHWEGDKHKVTFNPGPDGTIEDQTNKERTVEYGKTYGKVDGTTEKEFPEPTKTGYTFRGWLLEGTTITETTIVEITENKELTADWEKTPYTLTIDLNGGTVNGSETVDPIPGTYTDTVSLPSVTTPTGFIVTLDRNDGTNITTTVPQTTTLSKWTKEDGTDLPSTTEYTFGASNDKITANYVGNGVPLADPSARTNYTFVGWYTEGGEKKETGFIPTENITLYAHWEGEKHTITFNPGEGATLTDPTKGERIVEYGNKYGKVNGTTEEPFPTAIKTGKTFGGWELNGTPITEETTVDITEDKELTAKWTDTPYTLTIDLNGGQLAEGQTGGPISGVYQQEVDLPTVVGPEGATVTLKRNDGTETQTTVKQTTILEKWIKEDGTDLPSTTKYTFGTSDDKITASYAGNGVPLTDPEERPGYEFKGWYEDIDVEATKKESGFIPTADITLLAKWEAKKYTITFNPGDDATLDDETKGERLVEYGNTYGKVNGTTEEAFPTATKTGKTFVGWALDGTQITEETTVEITENKELTAIWNGEKYTLTIELAGGKVGTSSTTPQIEREYGQTVDLPTVTEGPAGYTITINNNNETGATRTKVQETEFDKWLKEDGTELPSTTQYTFGASNETITASYKGKPISESDITAPVRPGYDFVGWFTQAEGGDEVTMPFTPEGDMEIFAHWQGETHTVTFNAGEGVVVEPSSKPVELGKAYGELPEPTKTGYDFKGWYTDVEDETTQVTEETIFETRADVTLTAGWEAKKYTITFNAGEGITATPTTKEVEYGKTYGDLATATKLGATLEGWCIPGRPATGDTPEVPEIPITAETIVNITEDTELMAKWTNTKYTLTLNLGEGHLAEGESTDPIKGIYGETVDLPEIVGPLGYKVTLNDNYGTAEPREIQLAKTLSKWTKEDGTDLTSTTQYTFGTSNETITAVYTESSVTVADPEERPNYTFKGWYVDVTDESTKKDPTFVPTANTTLVAKWEGKKYTVTFNAGDGVTNPESREVTFGGTYGTTENPLPQPTKPGATFNGWCIPGRPATADTPEVPEIPITDATIVEITEDTELMAKWINTEYTLTLDLGEGHLAEGESTEPIKGIYGETVNLPQIVGPLGYKVTLNDNYGTAESREIQLPKTLSKWTKEDGTDLTSTIQYTFGTSDETITAVYTESSVTVADPEERPNYTFKGWYVDVTDESTKKDPTFVPTANTTLVAKWEGEKHKVTFNPGEHATMDETKRERTVEYGKTYGELPTPTKPGATFNGWCIPGRPATGDTPEVPEIPITAETIVTITEDTELTAKWINTEYTLTLNLGDGHLAEGESTEPIKGIYGETVNLPQIVGPLGYKVTLNDNYGTAEPREIQLPKTLSKWTKTDGTDLTSTTEYTFGASNETITATYTESSVDLGTPTRTGYEFKGWYTDVTDETTKKAQRFTPTANTTLVAKWEARKYTVTFVAGTGATVSPATKQVTFGGTYGTAENPLPTPNKTGYDFAGWYRDVEDETTRVTNETLVEITQDTTLTAKWGGRQFTVTFNNGDGTSTSKTVTNGNPYGELPSPTKQGNTFDGWYDENNNKIESTTIVELTEDITLNAKYNPNEYIVVFKNDDGSTIDAITVEHGGTAQYQGETPQKNDLQRGYQAEFTGWTNADKLQNVTENITVTATYTVTPITYTITYKNTDNSDNSQNPTTYTINSEDIILKDLVVEGEYEFLGWYDSEDEDAQKITSIDTSKLENIILYARWDERKLYLRSEVYKIGENDIDRYEPNDVYLDKIAPETTVAQFIKNCKTNGTMIVINADNQELGQEDIVGTGMHIKVTKGNEEINLIAVVMGDTSGDGEATPEDMSDIKDVILKNIELDGAMFKAADIDDTKKVTSTDLSDINKTILKLIKLVYVKNS